jgi:cytochrome P450
MHAATAKMPVRLTGPTALAWGLRFARDPLSATRRMFDKHGPFVILAEGLPFTKRWRATLLGTPLVFTAGAALNAELLSDPEIWRGVSVLPGGPKNSAAQRMIWGLPRLTGERHAHYRKLIGQPLRRTNVEVLTAKMARLAEAEVKTWPVGEPIDLWDAIRRMMQRISAALLFGGDSEECRTIAKLSGAIVERKWGPGAFAVPINIPITAYGQIVRQSEDLERLILRWVTGKRGRLEEGDLASIIVNSPDAHGNPPDAATIVAHIASLFALSSEGSQSALTWTLILLAQHPRIACALCDELKSKIGGGAPSLDKAGDAPYLDAVVKESMRILPPVPLQIRVAQCETTLGGYTLPERARVMLNTFLTNRMPDLFPDGNVYSPERWSTLAPNAFEFPVFSAGPHLCSGYWFGTAAVKIGLAAILTRYRLELASGTRIDYRAQPALRPRQRIDVVLQRANGAVPAAMPLTGKIRELVKFPQ